MYTEITIGTLTATGETASIHLHRRPLVITGDSGTGKTHAARLITALPATRHMPRYVFDRTNAWNDAGPDNRHHNEGTSPTACPSYRPTTGNGA